MAVTNSNAGQSSLSNFDQKMYADFSGGFNDTTAAISIDDNQMALSENADYSIEAKALVTRKGCTKVNENIVYGDITDGYAWLIGSAHKKCVVTYDPGDPEMEIDPQSCLYDVNTDTGEFTFMTYLTPGAKHIYPYVMHNTLYFGDGTELYVWGYYDYTTESGEQTVIHDQTIVKCNNPLLGEVGHFYKYVFQETPWPGPEPYSDLVDLSTEDYLNSGGITVWEDVTDVEGYSSNYVRPLIPHDSSQAEIVKITIYNSPSAAGTLALCLNDEVKTIPVTDSMSIDDVMTRLAALEFEETEWDVEVTSGNTVTFTCQEKKTCNAGYIDPTSTGINAAYNTVQEGYSDNNDLTPIKKCTIFCVHTGSNRVFAAGNPDDPAIWYSEIGYGNYFQSVINKLYPAINGYGKVTGMINMSNALVVSYENGWYTWKGITPLTDALWQPLNIPYGCVNPRTLVLTPQSFTYLAKDGIYTVSAAILNEQYILLQTKQVINKISENVGNTIDSIVDLSLCTAVFYEDKYMLAYSTDGEICDRVLKYEWDTGSFTVNTGWLVYNWLNDHENLFFASKNYLLKADDGYSDIDVETGEEKAIELHVKTKEYFFDTPQTNKVVQMISLFFKQSDRMDVVDTQFTIHANYNTYHISPQDLTDSLIWNRIWGKIWGYKNIITRVIETVIVSNTFQIEITDNNINNPLTLIGIGFSYADTDLVLPTILKDEELLK